MVVRVGDKDFKTTIDSIMGEYISSSDGRTKILVSTAQKA